MSFPSDQRAQYRKLSVAGQFLRAWAGFEPATPSRSNRLNYQAEFFDRGGWIRTTGKRNQNPTPYRLATPPVLRQGIEPKAAAYESAALPLSYLNNIRKELTPLWRSDSLRYSREFLLSKRSPGERPDKRNWPPAFSEPGELASLTRKIFCAPRTGPFIGLARSLLCSSPQVLRLGSRGLGTNTLTCRDDLRRDR